MSIERQAGIGASWRRVQALAALVAAIVACPLQAAPDDPVQVSDQGLLRCVEEKLENESGATITETDMARLDSLYCSRRVLERQGIAPVSSLAGLEFAVNLSTLTLVGNVVADLSPLADLTSLTALWLGGNRVSDVSPLARLTKLTKLSLGENAITDVSALAGLTSLKYLGLYSNTVVDVSALRGLTALESLYLNNNHISDIAPLAANAGLGDEDYIELRGNPLGADAYDTHIPALQGRGVTVYFDPRTTYAAIPDPALRRCLEQALDKEADEAISQEELAALTSLACRSAQVSNLSGISGATSLAELDLRDNVIADIAALAANSGLGTGDVLDLRGNPLNANAHDTHIQTLRSRGATVYFDKPDDSSVVIYDAALRHCVEQALGKGAGANIRETEMGTLHHLDCSAHFLYEGGQRRFHPVRSPYGAVSSLAGLEFAANLAYLSLVRNAVSDLSPLAGLLSLTELALTGNAVSDLSPLADLASLTYLWLGGNSVSDISPLARLTNLTQLNLGANAITDVSALAGLTSLKYLGLYSNTVVDVSALRGLTALESLYLANNHISDIAPLAANVGLGDGDVIELAGNPLDADAHGTHIPALQGRGVAVYFDPRTTYAAIPDAALRRCLERALDKEADEAISQEELAALTSLACRSAQVSDLSGISGATSLAELDLRDNVIADIAALAANSGLGTGDVLDLRGNPLNANAHDTHIPTLKSRGASVYFDKPDDSSVAISDAALRHCVEQALGKSAGATISETEMATLHRLGCSAHFRYDNGQRSFDPVHSPHGAVSSLAGLEFATNLSFLNLNHNAVSDLSPLADLPWLTTLYLSSNAVSDLSPLAGLSSLTGLLLTGNAVSDISSLAGLASLTDLWLGGNSVSDISPLARLTNLTQLNLGANAITDISALAGLASLEYLGLYSNTIADVSPLRGLAALSNLPMANNRISDIAPLAANAGLGDGDSIELTGNPIACGNDDHDVVALRSRGATVFADAVLIAAPPQLTATSGDGTVQLHWHAPAGCHVASYEVRYGVGKSPDFGLWLAIDDGSMRHAVDGLVNGRLYAFEVRAVGSEGGGQARRTYVSLAEDPVGPVAIVDERLSAGIAQALGKTTSPTPPGRASASSQSSAEVVITQGEMAALTSLDLRGMDIVDLTGLEYALNLSRLLLSGNRVSSLDAIVGLQFLSSLDLGANGLSDISSLSGMSALERLWLNDNEIADVWPLAANMALGEGDIRTDGSSDYVDLRGNPLNSDSTESHVPALRERGAAVLVDDAAHLLAGFAAAGNRQRQSFARIINPTGQDGEVTVTAIDESGSRLGPARLRIRAGKTVHFNSDDLENGNSEKGLHPGVGAGAGDWRLELRSSLPIEAFAYVRHADGLVTSMSALAPEAYAQHQLPTFNPGSGARQASKLRVINPAAKMARVLIEGVDDGGTAASAAVTVPAGGVREFTAAALEQGVGPGIVDGGLGDGVGKWRLTATSFDGVHVLNVLDSPAGHRANLSAAPVDSDGGVHHLPLLPSAAPSAALLGREGFVRVVNRSPRAGRVRLRALDAEGISMPAGTLSLDAGGTAHFSSQDLEHGNAGKGLTGVALAQGDLRLELRSDLDLSVYGYVRTADGFVDSIHETVPTTATGAHRLVFFNSARNTHQASRLRIVNMGDAPADVRISGADDEGAPAAAAVRLTIPANATRELTAEDLETGQADGLAGALSSGSGKWQLLVESESRLAVMSLLEHGTGHLTNLSR